MKESLTHKQMSQRTGLRPFLYFVLLMAMGLVSSVSTIAQSVSLYSFTQTAGTYTPITGGTILVSGAFDNQVSGAVTIPSFNYAGTNYTSIYISANGFITFGSAPAASNYTPISSTATYAGAISAFAADLGFDTGIDAGASPEVRHELVGNEYVIQWQDVKRWNVASERISFQIRLNTSTNVISIAYGGTITPGSKTTYLQTGLRGATNTYPANINNRTIVAAGGAWLNSTNGTSNSSTMYFNSTTATTVPASGTTFTWTPPPPCVVPSAQATALVLTPSSTSIAGSYTAASPTSDGYLVVRTSGPAPTNPVNGTAYTAGATALGGTIVYAGNATTFSSATLSGNTSYSYYVFSYNSNCSGGPTYNTTSPLTETSTTCPVVPATITTSAISTAGFTLNWASSLGGGASAVTYTVDVATDNAFASPVVGSPFTVTNPTVTQAITGLNGGTTYYYRIRANGSCNSAYSSTSNVITLCNPASIPTTVEPFGTSTTPNCWSRSLVTGSTNWATISGNSGDITGPYAGTHFIEKHYTASDALLYSLPLSYTSVTNPTQINVWMHRHASAHANDRYRVFVNTSASLTGATQVLEMFSKITSAPAVPATGWYNYQIPIPASFHGQAQVYVIFQGTTTNSLSYDLGLDDFRVEYVPTCFPPTALVLNNTSANGADLSWTAPVAGTPANYLWKVVANGAGANGAAVASGSVAHPTLNTSISGLSPNTVYQAYIRTNCGGGDTSAWSVSSTFTTLCDAANIPYVMPIEVVTTPALPSCVTVVNVNSDVATWKSYPSSLGPTGWTYPVLAYLYNEDFVTGANDWLYTRGLNLIAGTSYTLTFKYNNDGTVPADAPEYWSEKLKVMYGSAATVAGMTLSLADYPLVTNATPQNATIYFTPPSTGVYYIGFQAYSDADKDVLVLDDIAVNLTPTCLPPTNLSVSNIGGQTANVSWTAPTVTTPANYIWKVVAAGAGSTGTAVATGTVAAPATSAAISGLSVTTNYDVYVRSECGGGDSSAWSARATFKTIQNPVITFPYVTSFEGGLDEWQTDNGSQTNKWEVGAAVNAGGTQSLYVSNDAGVTNAYGITSTSTVHAYRDFQLPAGFPLIQLSFKWQSNGDAANDRMRVYIAPTSFTPSTGTQMAASGTAPTGIIQLGGNFSGQSTFTTANYTLPFAYESQSFRLIFEWRNNASGGNQPPAAIDSVELVLGTCASPISLSATPGITTASLAWTELAGATQWNVEYGLQGFTPGTGTLVSPATNPQTISTLSPHTNYSYYVQSDCGSSQSPWTGPYTFQTLCQPSAIVSTTPATRCGLGTVTLGAATTPGTYLNWYGAASGGVLLDTGSVFVTPSINSTTTYYVQTSAPLGNSVIGAGASTGTGVYNPTNGGYGSMKGQYLFTAAELLGAGINAGDITALALNFTSAGSTLQGFTIQAGTTGLTTFPTPVSILGGLSTLYSTTSYAPTVGLNTFNFNAPFYWDGISNIVISTSWGNNNASNTTSTIAYDATTNYSSQSYRKDNETGSNLLAFSGATGTGTSTFDRSQNRPKMSFATNCVSARVPVIATVTTPPAIVASNDTAICGGGSTIIKVSSVNAGYSYVWTPGNLTNAQETVTPTATTTYTVTATDVSGGANDGCINTESVVVTVNSNPPSFTIDTPSASDMCMGTTEQLSTSFTPTITLFSENFEGVVNMTTVNTSTGTNPATAAWTVRNSGYQNTGGTIVYTFNSSDNSKFILTNSDPVGNGAVVVTDLISPVINTVGYNALSLKFNHHFKSQTTSAGTVAVSTDGGTNWTNVQTYTGTDEGTSTAFVNANLNLDAYVNNANLRIRFRYSAAWNWFWAIDNISVQATLPPLETSWTATPAGAGLPAGAETPSVANSSISVTPTGAGVYNYVATVTTAQGCTSTSSANVTVNTLPAVDAGPTQTDVCPGSEITLTGSGAATYTWDNGVTNAVPFYAPNTSTLYTVTGTDANLCSNTDTVRVFVLPVTPVSITPAGTITTCQNDPVVLTANGPAPGPAAIITQWNFNADNLVPAIGTGTASAIGGITPSFVGGAGSTDVGAPNRAWTGTAYPAQGTLPKTAGVQFNVSTSGYSGVKFKFDSQFSNTAANTLMLQYNPDVTNALAPWINVQSIVTSTGGAFVNDREFDLSSIPAANDNPNLGIRLVTDTAGGTGNYVAVNAPTNNYMTGGTMRYDMVTFTGQPLTATYSWSPVAASTPTFTPTVSGIYKVTVTQPGVCPGVDSVTVIINPIFASSINATICSNQTYPIFGVGNVSIAGLYPEYRTSVKGCDSTVLVNLTVYPVYDNTIPPVTICSNESYTLAGGDVVTTAGTYTRIVPSIHNCDSSVTVTIIVTPAQSTNVSASICAGDSYTLPNGTTVTAAGVYPSTFNAINGCDSTIITTLVVKPVYTATQNPVICSGDTYTMPDGTTQDAAGTYAFPYTAVNGCDSAITVNLTVNPVYTTNLSIDLCPGETYTMVDGTQISTAGQHQAITNTINGCDSTVIVTATMRSAYNTPVTASICQGGNYTLVNGTHVSTAGSYTSATQSIYGCDSIVVVTLTVNPTYNQTATASICQGDTYQLPNGNSVTTAGVYSSTLTSSKGCDSIIVTTLTVNPSPNVNLGNDIAILNPPVTLNAGVGFASYLWNTGATTSTLQVTQNGTYSVTVTNQFGCDASDEIQVNFLASVTNLGENGGSISLFPNPTSERFTINVYGYTGGGSLKLDIINAIGQVVKTEMVGNATESFSKEMDVTTLASGTYTLRVKGQNAEANLRLIIAR